jgi:hypothetical protein
VCAPQPGCAPAGQAANGAAACCSGYFVGGSCACFYPGGSCNIAEQCCSGTCQNHSCL